MKYEDLEPRKLIELILKDRNMTPCLLIGKYVNVFKQVFTGTIVRAYSLENVRHIIEEYDGISRVNSGTLVLEGIGYLSSIGQNSLLKFIEESSLPVVLLSYNDNVINTIRSRMKITAKLWEPIKDFNYLDLMSALRAAEEKKASNEDFKGNNEIQFYADTCPKLYVLKSQAGNPYDYSNNKMLSVISAAARAKKELNNG